MRSRAGFAGISILGRLAMAAKLQCDPLGFTRAEYGRGDSETSVLWVKVGAKRSLLGRGGLCGGRGVEADGAGGDDVYLVSDCAVGGGVGEVWISGGGGVSAEPSDVQDWRGAGAKSLQRFFAGKFICGGNFGYEAGRGDSGR